MINIDGESTTEGITESGFLTLMRLFILRDRPETVWMVLKAMHYDASLQLSVPRINVLSSIHYELSVECQHFLLKVQEVVITHDRYSVLMIVMVMDSSHLQR